MELLLLIITPCLMALGVPLVASKVNRHLLGWVLAAISATGCIFLLAVLPQLNRGEPLSATYNWVPALGLTLSLKLDGLAALFAILITGIGAAVILYAAYYFDEQAAFIRFIGLLTLFAAAMLGLVLSANILLLFICWEATSITSFFLISFYGRFKEAQRGALQALMVTGSGGLALLVGLMMLGYIAGTYELSGILAQGEILRAHPLYPAATLLIMLGCFTKSAQFPLHFWLPDAMSAPTPASAYLHSATMVKAGIYLLARLYPALGNTALWETILVGVGLMTMLVGAVLALRQRDLKGALAYSTISQLGALVALIGLPAGHGLKAVAIGVLGHGLYKAALFLGVGIIDHTAHTRMLDQLGGLFKSLRWTAALMATAALSMAGIPPLLGFLAKETLLDSFAHEQLQIVPLIVVTISAALTVAMALILIVDVFGGVRKSDHADYNPANDATGVGMLVGIGLLAVGSVVLGTALNPLLAPIIAPVVGKPVTLYLFSGINLPLLLSATAILGGLGVFATRRTWREWNKLPLPSGRAAYQWVVSWVEAAGDLVLKSQHGQVRQYLAVILSAVVILMAAAGVNYVDFSKLQLGDFQVTDLLKVALLVLSLAAMFASIFFKQHLSAALALGVAGYSIGALFVLEPGPDIALVQFLVETLGTVLVIVMLGKIAASKRRQAMDQLWDDKRPTLIRDIIISTLVGVGVALFSLAAVINRPERQTIATWHIDNAKPLIGVNDIVATIVTDFRGMDTVIEITVFGMAALGVLALLSTSENKPRSQAVAADESQFSTPLTRQIAVLVLPFAFLIGFAHLLYSGDAPGDGFTAGVVTGLGVALWYVVFGHEEARRRLTWLRPAPLVGLGIGLAVLNAGLPLLFGKAFLITTQLDLKLPADIHLSSTTVFETAIFLCVLGACSIIIETIANPGEVEPL